MKIRKTRTALLLACLCLLLVMSLSESSVSESRVSSAGTPEYAECGDINGSGFVDIDDIIFEISYVYSGGAAPSPKGIGDINCDDKIDLLDIVPIVNYVFRGGEEPCLCRFARVFGTITWPGHDLTSAYAFLDTSQSNLIVIYENVGFPTNEAGEFEIRFELPGPIAGIITGWDDLDHDLTLEPGEPLGFWDINSDGMWNNGDRVTLLNGRIILDADVILYDVKLNAKALPEEAIRVRRMSR
jgi:hypothetical protein